MQEVWFRPLVWMDYRLALLFTLAIPLILFIWAFVQKAEAIQSLLVIYWRVGSLLAITTYLMIASLQVAFLSGLVARILMPISLWFWVDLNDDIEDQPTGPLKIVFTSWRWAVSVYCGLGAIALVPFLQCTVSQATFNSPFCQVWLEPPLDFKDYFHHNTKAGFLGFLAVAALIIYVLYLSYFVVTKLGRYGRSALHQ